ncbi:MAG: DNA helicase RecQ [Aestuariivirga sp.]
MSTLKHRILKNVFGFDEFRGHQEAVIDTLLAGRNVLAVMPTGSGKSLCYQVSALVSDGLTLVVSPLVALMRDQVAALKLSGVAAAAINSSQEREDNVAVWRDVAGGQISILYLSPERLMTERMIAALQKLPVALIAVDEAHCISQWGPSFRPDYESLAQLGTLFPGVTIGAFTATADEATRNDVVQKLLGGDACVFVQGFDRPNISLTVASKTSGPTQLLRFMAEHRGETGIVYCLSRKDTEETASRLREAGFKAIHYHAGMQPAAREAAQNTFMSETEVVVCATIAFGMGIDKPDVRFVFHLDMPGSLEAYYQEIGRAGRDGLAAAAHMLFGLGDIAQRRRFVEESNADDMAKRRDHKRLDALVAYAEAPSCRRQMLLAYFGESSGPCGNCDICRDPRELTDGSNEGRTILAAILATGERFGPSHIADVLRGSETERIAQFNHAQLSAFGSGKQLSRTNWLTLMRQMVGSGFLRIDVSGYGAMKLGPKARGLLAGEDNFLYRAETLRGGKRLRKKAETTVQNDAPPELLNRLKALRRRLAEARRVPPYVIFSDRSLIDMAAKAPKTEAEFAAVHGVGEAKLRDLAKAFLAEIGAE